MAESNVGAAKGLGYRVVIPKSRKEKEKKKGIEKGSVREEGAS